MSASRRSALLRWLPLMQAEQPDISIRAESALEPELMQGLVEGRIDIGVMYTPQSRPGLKVEQLFEEQLILSEFFGAGADGEYRLARIAACARKRRLRIFARRIVEPLLRIRRLHAVAGAPVFSMPAYVAYLLDREGSRWRAPCCYRLCRSQPSVFPACQSSVAGSHRHYCSQRVPCNENS
jgi:LysR family transcriptional regulator, flagellar master operon regulator